MKQNDQEFLDLYKQIENAIPKMKDAPTDANMKWYEDTISDPSLRAKLYICRILRNYIQHNSDYQDFISIHSGMISFLQEIYLIISSNFVKNQDIMVSGKQMIVRNTEDNIIETIKKMDAKKQEYVPILKDGKMVGIFSDKTIRTLCMNGNQEKTFDKILNLLKIPYDVKFVKPEETLEKTLDFLHHGCKMVLCTNNGKSTGKILGMIRIQECQKEKM